MSAGDCDAVALLLTKGFAAWRDASFWQQALRRLGEREAPADLPRFGYVLEVGGDVVGVLLVIASETVENGVSIRRCNVSSWYVEPSYRLYGTLLVRQALRHRDVTYMNVTPAPETWNVLQAQGYRRYVSGRAVAVPALAGPSRAARVVPACATLQAGDDLPEYERALLLQHTQWDCLSLVCHTDSGRVPFVFGLRRHKGMIRFTHLLYCRSLDEFTDLARPIGLFLMRRGVPIVVADANAKLKNMPGKFQGNYPKFFRGDLAPRPGDLAFTERAVFGV